MPTPSKRPTKATRVASRALGAAVLLGATVLALARADAQELEFASAADARAVLSSKDEFVARMSPFDRAARMKSDRPIAEAEYLEFAAAAALDWTSVETSSVRAAFHAIEEALETLRLPLPKQVLLVKTTGREEGNAAYTRGNAVIFPRRLLDSPATELQRLLAHELFHVASRANPRLAGPLYQAIGFRSCGEAAFPPNLANRKLTNPDAPRNDYCIRVKIGNEEVPATPILFSRSETYDRASGGEFFDYLQVALLLRVEPAAPSAATAAVEQPGAAPRIVTFQQVSGFFEQVGHNTEYIIHPEEILADNFALLVLRAPQVPSPGVLTSLRNALAELDASPDSAPIER